MKGKGYATLNGRKWIHVTQCCFVINNHYSQPLNELNFYAYVELFKALNFENFTLMIIDKSIPPNSKIVFSQDSGTDECWFYSVTNCMIYSNLRKYMEKCGMINTNIVSNEEQLNNSCPLPDIKALSRIFTSKNKIDPTFLGMNRKPLRVIPGYWSHIMTKKYLDVIGLSSTVITCGKQVIKGSPDCILLCPTIKIKTDLLGRVVDCLPQFDTHTLDSACIIGINKFSAHYYSAVIEDGYYYVIEPYTTLKIPFEWNNTNNFIKFKNVLDILVGPFQTYHLSHVLYVKTNIICKTKVTHKQQNANAKNTTPPSNPKYP